MRSRCAIIVMGVSGCGKSTLGGRLALELGGAFVEGDDLHDAAAVAKMRAGRALDDGDRWPWLDRIGRAADAALAGGRPVVVACSALKRRYRDRLRAAISAPLYLVWLEAGPETLEQRIERRSSHYMPVSLLESQLATLERPEPDEGALTLDASRPVEELCASTLGWLLAQPEQV